MPGIVVDDLNTALLVPIQRAKHRLTVAHVTSVTSGFMGDCAVRRGVRLSNDKPIFGLTNDITCPIVVEGASARLMVVRGRYSDAVRRCGRDYGDAGRSCRMLLVQERVAPISEGH